jgi:hypothetical protein
MKLNTAGLAEAGNQPGEKPGRSRLGKKVEEGAKSAPSAAKADRVFS